MAQLNRIVVATAASQWEVRASFQDEALASHNYKESAIQHALSDLDRNAGGGMLQVYAADGVLERSELRPGTTIIDEAQQAIEKADGALQASSVVIGLVSMLVPSFVTSLFSPTVAENSDSFLGVVLATFAWSAALCLATMVARLEGGVGGTIVAFVIAIVITSFIAGFVGLQTMPFGYIQYLAPSDHPFGLAIGAIRLAVWTYGPGGAVLGAIVGIGTGIWLAARIERSEQAKIKSAELGKPTKDI